MSTKTVTIFPARSKLPVNVMSAAALNAIPPRRVAVYARVGNAPPSSPALANDYAHYFISKGGRKA